MKIQLSNYNIEQQLFTNLNNELLQLCSPITQLGIKVFARVRIWNDASISVLTTHPSFAVEYVKNALYKLAFGGSADNYHEDIFLVQTADIDCTVIKAINELSIQLDNFTLDLAIIEKFDEYLDLYWFGTDVSVTHIANFYFNRLEALKKFIEYFKVVGDDLLTLTASDQLIYPSASTDKTILTAFDDNDKILLPSTNTLNIVQLDTLTLKEKYNLSHQESLCASFVKQGLNCKQIAEQLNISARTAEKHIANLKRKSDSKTLSQLANKLHTILAH